MKRFYNNIIKADIIIKATTVLVMISAFSFTSSAQDEQKTIGGIYSATSISIGGMNLLDTYLSPIDYEGLVIGVMNERVFMPRFGKNRWIAQQYIRGDYGSNTTIYGSGKTITGFFEYSFGMLYKVPEFVPNLNIYGGGYASGNIGFIYNLRNGNNPVSAKTDVSLGGSVMATYKLNLIKNFPLNLRYQMSTPLIGAFFCPNYEQSYYEIFSLGNSDGIVHTGVWGKRFDITNIITVDIPLSWIGLRLGYENRIYNNHANSLKYRRVMNSFLIGVTRDFIPNNKKKDSKNIVNVISPIF